MRLSGVIGNWGVAREFLGVPSIRACSTTKVCGERCGSSLFFLVSTGKSVLMVGDREKRKLFFFFGRHVTLHTRCAKFEEGGVFLLLLYFGLFCCGYAVGVGHVVLRRFAF